MENHSERRHTGRLGEERENITPNKYLCEPRAADDAMCFTVREKDDSAKNHVDTRSEEGGCDEEKECLDKVWG